MNKLLPLFVATALIAGAETFTGVISDSMCIKDHKAMNMGSDPDCVKACAKDKSINYVLLTGKKTYKLSDQKTPEQFAARRVKVSGTLYEKTGVIKVDRIEAMN